MPSMADAANRVFVVGTGRCGSTTFARACEYANNFTVAHEGATGRVHQFDYPENHIEVDPPLVFVMERLKRQYSGCRFVHLVREDRDACIRSLAHNDPAICSSFGTMLFHYAGCSPEDGAAALYDAINALPQGEDVLRVTLETISQDWQRCWDWMGCKGDFAASASEWETRHNQTPAENSLQAARGESSYGPA